MPGVSGATGVGTGAGPAGAGAGAAGGSVIPYGMILGGVGGILNTWAASKEAKAMYDTYLKELKRQGQFQQQAVRVGQENVRATGAGGYGGMLEQGAKGRENLYANMQQTPLTLNPIPSAGGAYSARDQAAAQQSGQFRAGLGAYQDAALGVELANNEANRQLAQIQNYSQGEADLLNMRMYRAQNSAWPIELAGNLLTSMGSMSTDLSSHFANYNYPGGGNYGGNFGGGGGGGQGPTGGGIYNYGSGRQDNPWKYGIPIG